MLETVDRVIKRPRFSIKLGTYKWSDANEIGSRFGEYYVSQRLSLEPSAVRLPETRSEVFRRVGSVGFLGPVIPENISPPQNPLRVLTCAFEPAAFEDMTEIISEEWAAYSRELFNMRNGNVESLMRQLHAEVWRPGFGTEIFVESIVCLLTVEIARHARTKAERSRLTGGLSGWQLKQVIERIDASPELGYPELAELATLCGISQSHLMRCFKVSMGVSLHKYVAEARMTEAKRMLARETMSAKEIAARLGFCSANYFTMAFRDATGMAPREFRKSVKAHLAAEAPEGRIIRTAIA